MTLPKNAKARFLGFEEPQFDPTARGAIDRVRALTGPTYLDKWVKYGPFSSRKSAQNAASKMVVALRDSELASAYQLVHTQEQNVAVSDDWYLFIKATPITRDDNGA